jgi:hypothetical protein
LPDGTGLELIATPAHGQIGGPVVFRFAATHADGHLPAGVFGEPPGFRGFCQHADLVGLQQHALQA